MSCHDIGRGMNSVVKVVISMQEAGEIPFEAAKKIIRACRKGVHWCDGNEPEAVECMWDKRCGKCLKEFDSDELIYMGDASYEWQQLYWKAGEEALDTVHDQFCPKCFDEVAAAITGDADAGPKCRAGLSSK